MSERPSVEILHDRKGVRIYLPDDMIDLTVDEARSFASAMQDAAESADKNEPPAPEPFNLDDHGKDGKEFAHVGKCEEKYDCYAYIAKYELSINDLMKLETWIHTVLQYHNKLHCVEDK